MWKAKHHLLLFLLAASFGSSNYANCVSAQMFEASNSSMLQKILEDTSITNQNDAGTAIQNVTISLLNDHKYSLSSTITYTFPNKVNLIIQSSSRQGPAELQITSSSLSSSSPSSSSSLGVIYTKSSQSSFHLRNIHVFNSSGGFFNQVTNVTLTHCRIEKYQIYSPVDYFISFSNDSSSHLIIQNTSIIHNMIESTTENDDDAINSNTNTNSYDNPLFLIGNRNFHGNINNNNFNISIENSKIAWNEIRSSKFNYINTNALFHFVSDSKESGQGPRYALLNSFIQSNYVCNSGSTFIYLGVSSRDQEAMSVENVIFDNNTITQAHGQTTDLYFAVPPASFICITPITYSLEVNLKLQIENSRISNSVIDANDAMFFYIEGVSGNIDFLNTEIIYNKLNHGRLIFMKNILAITSFVECTISENALVDSLFWYRIFGVGDLSFKSSRFQRNMISTSSVLFQDLYSVTSWSISDGIFEGNIVKDYSSLIYTLQSSLILSKCNFHNSTLHHGGTFIEANSQNSYSNGDSSSILNVNDNNFLYNNISEESNFFILEGQGSSVSNGLSSTVNLFHDISNNNISENYISSSSQLFWISNLLSLGVELSGLKISDSNLVDDSNLLFAKESNFVSIEKSFIKSSTSKTGSPLFQFAAHCKYVNVSNVYFSFLTNNVVSGPSIQINATTNIILMNSSFSSIPNHQKNYGMVAFFDESLGSIDNLSFEYNINNNNGNSNDNEYDVFVQDGSQVNCSYIKGEGKGETNNPTFNTNLFSCTPITPDKQNKSLWSEALILKLIIAALVLLDFVSLLYYNRRHLIKHYQKWIKYIEKMQRDNMTGKQLEGLIALHTSKVRKNQSENGLHEIKDVMRTTLPDIILQSKNIKLMGVIGKGGSGIVLKGRLGRNLVALKVVTSQIAGEGVDEIMNEIRMLYGLNHPDITRFYGICFYTVDSLEEYSELDQALMIVEEYYPSNLEEIVLDQEHPYNSETKFLNFFLPLLEIIQYLHEKNIVHRDLKPQNILTSNEGNPKLCDLGNAKFFQNLSSSINHGQVTFSSKDKAGTPGYMPPEVLKNNQTKYDPKAWDMFSLSMIGYFMWEGKHPLEDFENFFIINDEIEKGTRPVLPKEMPEGFRNVIYGMWHPNPLKRYNIANAIEKLEIPNVDLETDQEGENHIQMNPLMEEL